MMMPGAAPFVPSAQTYQPPPARYYSIDVECVATGTGESACAGREEPWLRRRRSRRHCLPPALPAAYSAAVAPLPRSADHNARSVAQISLVDEYERVLCNLYVRPEAAVVSYLTPLTGLTPELLERHGMPLEQAVGVLTQALPASAVLVGQNIAKDVQWLGLKEGQHYLQMMDLTGLFRVWNPKYKSWSVFGQVRAQCGRGRGGAPARSCLPARMPACSQPSLPTCQH